jgi:HEAT repeat protein
MPSASPPLGRILDALAAGEQPSAVDLASFSGIEGEDLAALRARWPAIDAALREQVLARAAELAEDSVDLDFSALARVGLDDPEPSVRRTAVEALWESEDRSIGLRLAQLLRADPDESVRGAAASGLEPFVLSAEFGRLNAADADTIVTGLREAASDSRESVGVRARAVESLGPRSLPWVDTLITDAYYDGDRRTRMAAVRAMGASAHERWLEYLEDQARSDDPEMRYEAANSIGEIASEDGVPILEELLSDEDAEVARAAISALAEIGGEQALDLLSAVAADEENPLREFALDAIATAESFGTSDLFRYQARDDGS